MSVTPRRSAPLTSPRGWAVLRLAITGLRVLALTLIIYGTTRATVSGFGWSIAPACVALLVDTLIRNLTAGRLPVKPLGEFPNENLGTKDFWVWTPDGGMDVTLSRSDRSAS